MARDKNDTEQELIEKPSGKEWLSPVLAQLAFLLAGVVLTATTFIILSVTIRDMVRVEYERVAENTAQVLADGLSGLEQTVETVSVILSLSEEDNKRVVADRVGESVPGLAEFNQVIWLYQTASGKWQFTNIHLQDGKGPGFNAYTIQPDREFLAYILKKDLFGGSKIKTLVDLPYGRFQEDSEAPTIMTRPFALAKTLKPGDRQAGIIIAISNAGHVLNQEWLNSNRRVSRLTIRDLETGERVYHLERPSDEAGELSGFSQVYEFSLGHHKWEVVTDFLKGGRVFFLESVPLYALVFGFVLTVVGTLFVRNSQKQSMQVREMNLALEQKNLELQGEVSERERLNQALRKSERENQAIIDSVSDIIFETDTEGKVLFLNATWQKVTGFDPEQSQGLELFKMLHPEDQDQQRRDFALLVKGQKQAYRSFTRLRISDGSFRAVELAVSMIRQDENKNLRVVGAFTDVEERRRAERALSEAEKKYRTIVENAAGGIYQLTPEGLYLSANPAMARILGYETPDQILREIKNANEAVFADPRARQNFLRDLEDTGYVHNFETQVVRRDGSKIWVNESARVVKDENGNTLYYEGSLEDITKRKQADIAMREAKVHSDLANRAKSEFLANMSHELRTPLNAIIGFSEIIKNEVFGPLEQKAYWEYAKDIHESGRSLLTIINEILDISKIEAGERYLNEGVVDLNKVVESCLDLQANKLEANTLTVMNALKEVPNVVGEELAIKQIIMNLLSNAVKFTPDGGRVTISSEVDNEGRLRLSVTDTGIGLDESEIEKALSPFGQVNSELSRSGSGTGLGLTLVDALVKLHDGELELFSQKGIGTTVTVVFPADRVAVKTAPGKAEESAQDEGSGKESEDAL